LTALCFAACHEWHRMFPDATKIKGRQMQGLGTLTQERAAQGVEMFKKQLNEGQAGDNVGLLLRSLKREDVVRGQVRRPPRRAGPPSLFAAGGLPHRHMQCRPGCAARRRADRPRMVLRTTGSLQTTVSGIGRYIQRAALRAKWEAKQGR